MTINQFKGYLKKNNKKHIIFDFDETLATLKIDWSNWHIDMTKLFQQYDPAFQRINPFDTVHGINKYVEIFGKEIRDKIVDLNYKNENSYYHGYNKNHVLLKIFKIASSEANVSIWTSNDIRTVEPILYELNIHKYITSIVTRNDVLFIKPHKEGFSLINSNNLPASQFLLIGDSRADEGAAKNAGIDFMHVSEFAE